MKIEIEMKREIEIETEIEIERERTRDEKRNLATADSSSRCDVPDRTATRRSTVPDPFLVQARDVTAPRF